MTEQSEPNIPAVPNSTGAVIRPVLQELRRKLLDTGTRNRLVHVNRENQRASCLNIVNGTSDVVFRLLRVEGKKLRFHALGQDKAKAQTEDSFAAVEADDASSPELAAGKSAVRLESLLGPDALGRRLLKIARDAKSAEEEQGINILFLAMGFLRWTEAGSSGLQREAPLVLLPVQLVRNQRTSTYDLEVRDEDLSTNLPLQERLRQDFGIKLPDLDETDDWTPSAYLAEVAEAVSGQREWSIDANGIQLGFFSFAKLLMHRDLDPDLWPETAFGAEALLGRLLTEGYEATEPLFPNDQKLDAVLDPADIIQIVDADASQTKVIEEVRKGTSLVVQGPPGTGKSQTITNMIAAAVHDGKSVLFVAEKMAALSVVHERLVKAGLQDICLELHSRAANKKAFTVELARTLAASAMALNASDDPAELRETRDQLNLIADLLHTPQPPHGETPFEAIAQIVGCVGRDLPPPIISTDGLVAMDREQRSRATAAIQLMMDAMAAAGSPSEHPFRGAVVLDLSPTDAVRLGGELKEAVAALEILVSQTQRLGDRLGCRFSATLDGVLSLARCLELLAKAPTRDETLLGHLARQAANSRTMLALGAGKDWAECHAVAAPRFTASAWTANLSDMRAAIVAGSASIFSRWFGPYRAQSVQLASLLTGGLPRSPEHRLELVDALAEIQRLRKRLAEDEAWLSEALGALWLGEQTDFAFLLTVTSWLQQLDGLGLDTSREQLRLMLDGVEEPEAEASALRVLLADVRQLLGKPLDRMGLDLLAAFGNATLDAIALGDLRTGLEAMALEPQRYLEWARLHRSIEEARKAGTSAVVDIVVAGKLPPDRAIDEFHYACAEARWNEARTCEPELSQLHTVDRHALVERFRTLERDRLQQAKESILARHYEQMPRGSVGEIGIIRNEIGRKRRHKPVRWVMAHAGRMVRRIKPVMLMSPISVAQYLPPGVLEFDMLIMDEASQVKPEDALGAIARAKQIVVVGDQKQLPPTSFFDRLVDDGEDEDDSDEVGASVAATADMESILSLCDARGLRPLMLEWHYRSRDPSLIQVSNAEFYGERLVLPPSPLQLDDNYGLKLRRVPGVYARGGSGLGRQGTNRIEAQTVVAAVAAHAREWPDLSLGIVAFSKAQTDMLSEIMEMERRRDPVLDAFLREGKHEDWFIKNIENVQGDERDVIMISVGYGPQEANGRLMTMTFGPINADGGERRLNVLFSRARVRCEVFVSFDPGDIDLTRTSREGPRVLKRFLEFARTGASNLPSVTGFEADSPFEADVAAVIRSLGYLADPQVGSSGFLIDIGVRHPDRPSQYILAVECDGATYHSALWARERDQLRQDVLENLGWRFHRIWSTDWFYNRQQEIQRLKTGLAEAQAAAAGGIRVRGSNNAAVPTAQAATPPSADTTLSEMPRLDHLELKAKPYRRAELKAKSTDEPHLVPTAELAQLLTQIVEIEGPIHIEEAARRVSAAYGKARTGSRIQEAVRKAASVATHPKKVGAKWGSPHGQHGASPSAPLRMLADFLLTAEQLRSPDVRDRSTEGGSLLQPRYLAPTEICAAADLITKDAGEMSANDLVRAVANLLGFRRVTEDITAAITAALARVRTH